jgi:predicted  nucleic acid-binding Zn-ribbon protein
MAELGRVQQRFTFADSKIVAIDSQINSLKNELPYKRESLKKLQEQYAEISKQKISEIKAKTDIEIAKQKSETERLAQQQAPILAAQQSRTKILTYFVIGGVVLILGGAFLLRNK